MKALSWRRERVEYYDPLTPFGGGLPGAGFASACITLMNVCCIKSLASVSSDAGPLDDCGTSCSERRVSGT